ncbi:MAG: tetratricopeptide repeat protein [Bacteroidota bacterium]|nr:tetratricopeptide repeat protein [Bacteroidota bacterium]
MKVKILVLLFILNSTLFAFGQTTYNNPLGFTIDFDKSWRRLPKEILYEKTAMIKDLMDYKKNIQYDACFQKSGNADMDYPYILFKNYYATTTNKEEIENLEKFYTDKFGVNQVLESLETDQVKMNLEIGKTYYDEKKQILIFTYNVDLNIKGKLVGLIAFYIGKSATLQILCYTYADEFKYDQKEFLDIIYSIKDIGMETDMFTYLKNHDQAVLYYNMGLQHSNIGNPSKAIDFYTLAIDLYPKEDSYQISEAYYNRGYNKRKMDNINGAISDYTKAIEFRPDYFKAFNNRGFAYLISENYEEAIKDFTSVIKYDNYQTEFTNMALGNRGIAKLKINQDGCADLKKAIEEGNDNVKLIFKGYCE